MEQWCLVASLCMWPPKLGIGFAVQRLRRLTWVKEGLHPFWQLALWIRPLILSWKVYFAGFAFGESLCAFALSTRLGLYSRFAHPRPKNTALPVVSRPLWPTLGGRALRGVGSHTAKPTASIGSKIPVVLFKRCSAKLGQTLSCRTSSRHFADTDTDHFDVDAQRRLFLAKPTNQQGTLLVYCSGKHVTMDFLSKFTVAEDQCPFCGHADSRWHRVHECI